MIHRSSAKARIDENISNHDKLKMKGVSIKCPNAGYAGGKRVGIMAPVAARLARTLITLSP